MKKVSSGVGHSQTAHDLERRGITLILLSALMFSAMSLCVRLLRDELRAETVVWYRSIFQLLFLAPFFLKGKKPGGIWLDKFRVHFLRGALGIASMYLLYQALGLMPLGLATLLTMTSVFWAAVSSRVFLKEHWTGRQIAMGALICCGVGFCLWNPGEFTGSWKYSWLGIVAALACGMSMGLTQTILRQMRQTFQTLEIVFFFGVCGVVLTTPVFLTKPEMPQSWWTWAVLVSLSAAATLGQLLMTEGFRYARTLTASLCQFQGTILNVLWGFLFLAEAPPVWFFLGAGLVAAGILGLVRARPKLSVPPEIV